MSPDTRHQDKPKLHFKTADHQVLGMQGPLIDTLRDNAPRVVGGLRLASILMASVAHPLLGLHALFVLGSEVVLLLFGNREGVEGYKTPEGEKPFLGPIGKAVQPHKYPLESSAALDVLGEIPHLILGLGIIFNWDISGIAGLLGEEAPQAASGSVDGSCPAGTQAVPHGTHTDCIPNGVIPPEPSPLEENYVEKYAQWQKDFDAAKAAQAAAQSANHNHLTGFALAVHGALGVLGHLPLWLFGPEKSQKTDPSIDLVGDHIAPKSNKAQLEFAQAKSTVVGSTGGNLMQWFTDNQVMISSVLQAAMAVSMMVATGMPDIYQWAGVPLLAGAVLQGALVSKSDFSAEAKKVNDTDKNIGQNRVHSATHTGKVKAHDPTRSFATTEYGRPA